MFSLYSNVILNKVAGERRQELLTEREWDSFVFKEKKIVVAFKRLTTEPQEDISGCEHCYLTFVLIFVFFYTFLKS